jgi:hypothetical protein
MLFYVLWVRYSYYMVIVTSNGRLKLPVSEAGPGLSSKAVHSYPGDIPDLLLPNGQATWFPVQQAKVNKKSKGDIS